MPRSFRIERLAIFVERHAEIPYLEGVGDTIVQFLEKEVMKGLRFHVELSHELRALNGLSKQWLNFFQSVMNNL